MSRGRAAIMVTVATMIVVVIASTLAFRLQPDAGQAYVAGTGPITAAILLYGAGGLTWITSTAVPLLSRGVGILSTIVLPVPILIVVAVNASREGQRGDYSGYEFAGVSICFPVFLWMWGVVALMIAYVINERDVLRGRPGDGFDPEKW